MAKSFFPIVCILFFATGCVHHGSNEKMKEWKDEIMKVEDQFNKMAREEGVPKAFSEFAADDGVIQRNGKLIKGKKAISQWYKENFDPTDLLTWVPEFIEVSSSGDLAYTYGSFVFTKKDSSGTVVNNEGTFHTVWKRQQDHKWKFVWD